MSGKELNDKIHPLCIEHLKKAKSEKKSIEAMQDVMNVGETVLTSGMATFINATNCTKSQANGMLDDLLGGLEDSIRKKVLFMYDEMPAPHTRIEV